MCSPIYAVAQNVANYLQQTLSLEGYLVAKIMQTGKEYITELLPSIDKNAADAEYQKIIQAEEIKAIAKRQLKLVDTLMRGCATVYAQCSQEVHDKLKATDNWYKTQREQSLDKLIQKIKCICFGFGDHKQECLTW
jgi:hypothetical protein